MEELGEVKGSKGRGTREVGKVRGNDGKFGRVSKGSEGE